MQHKPNVVLVHGWGIDSQIWQPLIARLNDYQVHCIDLPGYATQLDNDCEWQIAKITDDIAQRTPKDAIWLGWSLGGLLCLYIAIQKLTPIKGLILIASNPSFSKRPDWPHGVDQQMLDTFTQACQENEQALLTRFKSLCTQGADKATIRHLRQLKSTIKQSALLGGLQLLANTDLRKQLKHIDCPQSYLYAANDGLVPLSISESLGKLAHNAKVSAIEHASHALPISHSEQIYQELATLRDV